MCMQAAPGAFRIGDDGLAVAVEPSGGSSSSSAGEIAEAADSCPMAAIAIVPADVDQ